MSQNVFPIDPIFFMPIDFEEFSNKKEKLKKQQICKNDKIKTLRNIEKNNILINSKSDFQTNECISSEKNLSESIINQNENKNIITFSSSKDNRNIKSMTNSSKIYISEIFKRNWKLKSRRLIAKLKKKLIKQWKQAYFKENNKNSNFVENNKNSNENIINSKLNIINNNDFEYNNCHIKNSIQKINLINNKLLSNNNFNVGNLVYYPNICTNININFNKYNNNLNLSNNSVYNNTDRPKYNFNFMGNEL